MIVLYDYWRSSAAYRLRIALNLMDLDYRSVPVDLLTGEHSAEDNLARNAQGLVPTLEIDGQTLTQSLAVVEYLDETRDAGFLPKDPRGRARVRALSYAIAMEIHAVCNLSVARFASDQPGEITMASWMTAFIPRGLAGVERMLADPATGRYCHGDRVTMADLCLVPQLYNARRWEIDLQSYPEIRRIDEALEQLEPIRAAHPERVRPQSPS